MFIYKRKKNNIYNNNDLCQNDSVTKLEKNTRYQNRSYQWTLLLSRKKFRNIKKLELSYLSVLSCMK